VKIACAGGQRNAKAKTGSAGQTSSGKDQSAAGK
jgi:hypothetical protein